MSKNPDNLKLDQLFDLKRSEKPADDFWDGFQKEFRQRQLQTLIEKESQWSRMTRLVLSRTSVWVPLSSAAVALFVLAINFQKSYSVQKDYFETADSIQKTPEIDALQVVMDVADVQIAEEAPETFPSQMSHASASFVMDLIPNEEPESISYKREFPTSTIPAENRAVSALVSYTLARETPAFGLTARPRTIGF